MNEIRRIVELDGKLIAQSADRLAEPALLDSELKLRRITAAMPGAVYQFQLRSDGRQGFLSISDGIQDLIGYGAAAVVDEFSLLWDAVIPEDREELTNSILHSAQRLTPWEFEGRVRLLDQSMKWLRGQSMPDSRQSDGSIVWNGILTDVAERKRNEVEIARLAAIVENSGDAIVSRDLDLKIITWNPAAQGLFGYTADEVIGERIDLLIPHDKLAEVAHRRGQRSQGVETSPYDTVRIRRYGKRIDVSVTQSPIRDFRGKLVGVSVSLRDITKRKRMEKSLQLTQFSIDRAVEGIFWILPSAEIIYANDAACKILGYAREELIGKTVTDIDPSFPAEVWPTHWEELKQKGSLKFEFDHRTKDGKPLTIELIVNYIVDEGEECNCALMRDITTRKLVENVLRESERHLIAAQSIAHLGSWERNLKTGRSRWSDEMYRIFGYQPGAVTPSYELWMSLTYPEDRTRVHALRLAFREQSSADLEYRVIRPSGEVRHMHWRGELIRDGAGKELLVAGTVLDITERKMAEDALRQAHNELERRVGERTAELRQVVKTLKKTEAMLHQAVDVADVGIFERDHDSDEVYYSPTLKKILGLSDDQPGRVGDYMSSVYGDDREMVNLARQCARLPSGHGHIPLEHRIVRRDGSMGWVLFRGQTMFDGAGDGRRLVRTVGAVLDITECKRAEEALLASEERLQYALTVGKMGSSELDLRTDKVSSDERSYVIFGIPKGTEVGRDLFLAHVDPDHVDAVRDAHENSVRTVIDYDYDFRLNRPDGRKIWIHANGGLRRDRNGAATHLAGINLDITERKAGEEALRKLNEQLDQRVVERTQELAESQAGLCALVAELTQAEERERRRLAVELHDTLAQSLALVNMHLWRIKEISTEPMPGESMHKLIDQLDRTVADSIQYTRTLIAQLSPPVLYDLGLPAAFRWLGQQMRKHDLHVEVEGPQEGVSLPQDDAVLIFQCVRELLWNVVKHAKASRAVIAYTLANAGITVTVSDDGKGFESFNLEENGGSDGHFGLFSIRERLGYRGGGLLLGTGLQSGASVELHLPIGVPERKTERRPRPSLRPVHHGDLIRIAIVDAHKMLRQGLRRVLEDHGRFTVVGEAGDGAEAITLARQVHPEVVVMDVHLPTMSGISVTQSILQESPSTIVIGMSFGSESYVVKEMQAAGAVTRLPKERAIEDISQVILDALEGRRFESIL